MQVNRFKHAVLPLSGVLLSAGCTTPVTSELPNIILVVADDMGREISCYGDSTTQTPNINAFADVSYRFTNAYMTGSTSSPVRSSLLTGLYPHQNGQIGLSHRGFSMYKEYYSLPNYLKEQGYYTSVLGKLHVSPVSTFDFDYTFGGFDTPHKQILNNTGDAQELFEVDVITLDWVKKRKPEKFMRLLHGVSDTLQAIINNAGNKPVFSMINILDPHDPFYHQVDGYPASPLKESDVKIMPYIDTTGFTKQELVRLRKEITGYYNGIARADAILGKIIETLKKNNRYENSIIIFLGDNGAPFPGAKQTNYEAGIKVPFLVKMPHQKISADRKSFVSSIDLFPTIAHLVENSTIKGLPGISFLDVVNKNKVLRDKMFSEYHYHIGNDPDMIRSISTEKYKLIYREFYNDMKNTILNLKPSDIFAYKGRFSIYSNFTEFELYDLENDVFEKNNLAYKPEYKALRDSLLSEIKDWQTTSADSIAIEKNFRQNMLNRMLNDIKKKSK